MSWSTTYPDGSKSVKDNESIGQGNTTYIKTTLNQDHFWDNGDDEAGHHQFAQMPKYEDGGVPDDPTLATGMDLLYYVKEKTAAEATANQDVQPFIKNVDMVMQLLGIRAMGVFTAPAGVLTTVYSHNCTIARTNEGRFTATFTTAMPTANYCFLGGALANTTDTNAVASCSVESNTDIGEVKTTALVKFRTILTSGTSSLSRNTRDPLQAYFIVFGG